RLLVLLLCGVGLAAGLVRPCPVGITYRRCDVIGVWELTCVLVIVTVARVVRCIPTSLGGVGDLIVIEPLGVMVFVPNQGILDIVTVARVVRCIPTSLGVVGDRIGSEPLGGIVCEANQGISDIVVLASALSARPDFEVQVESPDSVVRHACNALASVDFVARLHPFGRVPHVAIDKKLTINVGLLNNPLAKALSRASLLDRARSGREYFGAFGSTEIGTLMPFRCPRNSGVPWSNTRCDSVGAFWHWHYDFTVCILCYNLTAGVDLIGLLGGYRLAFRRVLLD